MNNSIGTDMIDATELSDARNYMPDHLDAGLLIKRPALERVEGNGIQAEAFTSIFEGKSANWFTTTTK